MTDRERILAAHALLEKWADDMPLPLWYQTLDDLGEVLGLWGNCTPLDDDEESRHARLQKIINADAEHAALLEVEKAARCALRGIDIVPFALPGAIAALDKIREGKR